MPNVAKSAFGVILAGLAIALVSCGSHGGPSTFGGPSPGGPPLQHFAVAVTCSRGDAGNACSTSKDCATGTTCSCGDFSQTPNSGCVQSNCSVDSDCGANGYCSPSLIQEDCNGASEGIFCHTAKDQCNSDSDCGDLHCMYIETEAKWMCSNLSACAG
jgi:hypothetical protein